MLNLERAGAILSLFIPAVWQEHAKSSSPFSQFLWDGCENYLLVPSAIQRVIARDAAPEISVPSVAEVEAKLDEIAESLRLDVLNGMAAEFFEEERKLGFPGANKKALERLDAIWKTPQGRIYAACGKDVLHKLFDWVRRQFKVSLSALKLAKEISENELDSEVRQIVSAIEWNEPFS
jgi:hypothetical protein